MARPHRNVSDPRVENCVGGVSFIDRVELLQMITEG